ncbi:MAG TPA: ribosome maturation factor RimP [Steroidobacteraceae bacterium]
MRNRLFSLLEPVAASLGYELLEVEFSSAGHSSLVRVYIDRTDGAGVGLDDCERASRAIGAVLNAEDPIGHEYRLEVSSPGFDRPLRTAAHFARFAGSEARIELAAPLEGRRRFRGRLGLVEDGNVSIEVDRREWKLPLAGISKARLVG